VRKLLGSASLIAFAWTILVVASGGIDWHAGPFHLRSRDPIRPLASALVLVVAYAALARRDVSDAAQRASSVARAAAPLLVALAAGLLVTHALRFGAFVAGSSDAYGYVSQAYRWSDGSLPRAERVPLDDVSWPNGDAVQAPLGYRPGPAPHTIVPTYPPGLPMMMAVALRGAGPCGPYFVVPAFAALLIVATYLLGRRAGGPVTGLVAVAFILSSPIVLYQTEWPMSDVPVAALWTTALVAALTPSPPGALLSGGAAALALLARPNLLALAAVPLVTVVVSSARGGRARHVTLFCVPILAVAAAIAALNAAWYGSAWSSGYGEAQELYSLERAVPNLAQYSRWLWESQSPAILLAPVPLLPAVRRGLDARTLAAGYAMLALTVLSYIFYFVFDSWTYVRFLLPALGSVAVLMAAGLVGVARQLRHPLREVIAVVTMAVAVWHTSTYATAHHVFGTIRSQEHRYIDAAALVARDLPGNAVVFAMQHSGAVRFYAGRLTLRYDLLPSDSLDAVRADLERRDLHPYLLVDDWEIPYVQRQFAMDALPWPLVARMRENGGVSAYDLSTHPASVTPVALDPTDARVCRRQEPLRIPRPH